MSNFEFKAQITELVEKSDKNKDQMIDKDEKRLDQESLKLASKLRDFVGKDPDRQNALDRAIRDVCAEYKGLEPNDITQWVSGEKSTPMKEVGLEERNRAEKEAWENMTPEGKIKVLKGGAEAYEIPPEQKNRLGQLSATIALLQAFKSLIEKQKAESGISSALYQINIAFDTFKVEPSELLLGINNFLDDTNRFSAEILTNPLKPMASILSKHNALLKLVEKMTTSTVFGIEKGEGFNLVSQDCKTEEQLNQFKSKVIGILRDTDTTGGHFETAQSMATEALQPEFEQAMGSHFKTREQMVRVGGMRTKEMVIGELYDKSNIKIREQADPEQINKWKNEIHGRDPSLKETEILKKIDEHIEMLTLFDYQHAKREAIGQKIFDQNLYESWSPGKRAVWEQFRGSMGYGVLNASDENWDTVLTELMVQAPLIILSGGIASGARAVAGKAISYSARVAVGSIGAEAELSLSARAVVGGARMVELASGAGRMGQIGGRLTAGTAGMAVEGLTYEMANAGLQGKWVMNSPTWAKDMLLSAASMGVFSGTERMGAIIAGNKKILGKAIGRITHSAYDKGVDEIAKADEVGPQVSEGAKNTYAGNMDDFVKNFGEDLFHAYVSKGILKVSEKGIERSDGKLVYSSLEGKEGKGEKNKNIQA